MDQKSKILIALLIILTVASVGYTFWKTVVMQDLEIREDIPLKE